MSHLENFKSLYKYEHNYRPCPAGEKQQQQQQQKHYRITVSRSSSDPAFSGLILIYILTSLKLFGKM